MFFSPTYSFSLWRVAFRATLWWWVSEGGCHKLFARVYGQCRDWPRSRTVLATFFFFSDAGGREIGCHRGSSRGFAPCSSPSFLSFFFFVLFVVVVLHLFRANLFKRAHIFFLQNLICCTLCVLPTCPLSRDGEMCRDCRSKQPFFAPPPPSCELAVWNTVPNAKLVCGEWGGIHLFLHRLWQGCAKLKRGMGGGACGPS